MYYIFIFCSILSAINIYRRLNCVIKSKITKFNFISFLIFSSFLLILNQRTSNNLKNLPFILMICFSFFTSIISSGISKKGFIHPWNLFAKLYSWEKIGKIKYEMKKETVLISFETRFTDYRQEFEKEKLEEIKEFIYKNSKKKITEI